MSIQSDKTTQKLSQDIVLAGKWISERHWVPATGGNFSARLSQNTCLVTASGKHKGHLRPEDLVNISWINRSLTCAGKPSAEALLHTQIYDLDEKAQAIFHTHSVHTTVFSRLIDASAYSFQGRKMQKAIADNQSHEETMRTLHEVMRDDTTRKKQTKSRVYGV